MKRFTIILFCFLAAVLLTHCRPIPTPGGVIMNNQDVSVYRGNATVYY